jgi:hypothetical protein
MSVSSECCALSGRGLCVELITCPEESYRVWCVWVWSWSLDNEEALAQWGAVASWEEKYINNFCRFEKCNVTFGWKFQRPTPHFAVCVNCMHATRLPITSAILLHAAANIRRSLHKHYNNDTNTDIQKQKKNTSQNRLIRAQLISSSLCCNTKHNGDVHIFSENSLLVHLQTSNRVSAAFRFTNNNLTFHFCFPPKLATRSGHLTTIGLIIHIK